MRRIVPGAAGGDAQDVTLGQMGVALRRVVQEVTASRAAACAAASRIRVLHRAEFRAFLRSSPDAAMAVAGIVADKLRWSNVRRTDFARFPVRVRLARVLWDITAAYGFRQPSGVVVDIHITQAEWGTMCGAAEVSLQKAMRELGRSGIVASRYRGFVVRDREALREAAQLDAP